MRGPLAIRLLIFMLIMAGSAQAVMIDPFDAGPFYDRQFAGLSSSGFFSPLPTCAGNTGTGRIGLTPFGAPGSLSIAADPNDRIEATVGYGAAAPLGLDLSKEICILFDITFVDLDTALTTTIVDAHGATQSVLATIPGGSYPAAFALGLSAFNAVDLADVSTIRFQFVGESVDLEIDAIRTSREPVPEPATVSLLTLGLLALIRRRRRA
jgi:hypothetical protein